VFFHFSFSFISYIQHWDLVGFFVPRVLTDELKG